MDAFEMVCELDVQGKKKKKKIIWHSEINILQKNI